MKNRDPERLAAYVERFFARTMGTCACRATFPTVREAARALRWKQARVVQAVEDERDGRMFLSAYLTEPEQSLADHFVERT